VHMLTKEAFNALLKTLEEPPSHVKFIFATTSVEKLPETVQSRCQRFDFKNISLENITKQLSLICKSEKITVNEDVYEFIAKYARGGLRDALSVLDQLISFSGNNITIEDAHTILGTVDNDQLFELFSSIFKNDLSKAVCNIEELLAKGKGVTELTDQIVWYLRDILMAFIYKDDISYIDKNLSQSQIKIMTENKHLSVDVILYMIQILSDVKKRAKEDRLRRILLEVAIIKLATTENLCSINDLFSRLETVEKKLTSFLDAKTTNIPDNKKKISNNIVVNETVDKKDIPVSSTDGYNIKTCQETENKGTLESSNVAAVGEVVAKDVEANESAQVDEPENATLPDGVTTIWLAIQEKIKAKKKSLWASLQEATLLSYNEGLFIVEFPKEYLFHKERLERADEKKLIEGFAKEVTGKSARLKFELSKEEKKKDRKPELSSEVEKNSETKLSNEAGKSSDIKLSSELEADEQAVNIEIPDVQPNQGESDLPISKEYIINKDCVKKAIKIFDGRIVDIRRMDK